MKPESPNPYAPPSPVAPEEEVRLGIAASVEQLGSVSFAGCVSPRELDEYLRADGHVGCARLMILVIGFGGIFSVLPILGIPFLAISAGAMGLLGIAVTVSTLPYRRLMFINANPDWGELIRGSLQADGIHLSREHSSTYYHWNWYGEAITGENVIALLPATQTASPLLITREMLDGPDEWDRLKQVTRAFRSTASVGETEDLRRDENLRILKANERGWRFTPPADAIPFEGIVWSDDYERLPRQYRQRHRPIRTHLVIYGLVAFAGLILAGCSGVLFRQVAILPVLVAIYVIAAIGLGRRRHRGSGDVIFYLRGYALDSSIVTDFGLAVSDTEWAGLSMVADEDQHVVLRRCSIHNFIVIRQDMLADEATWIQFRELLRKKIACTTTRSA